MQRRELLGLGAASLLLSLGGCARPLAPAPRQSATAGRGRIIVDPRIELISIVLLLGGYRQLTDATIDYATEVRQFFGSYQSHPAVETAKRLSANTFTDDAVPSLMLRLTLPDALTWRTDLPAVNPPGIPDAVEREAFLVSLRDFARVSRFQSFFDQHSGLYRQIVSAIEADVVPKVDALEAYTAASLGQWTMIAGLLLFDGGYGPSLTRTDGSLETYAILGPSYQSVGVPDFPRDGRLQDLLVHEFAHSLINPLAAKYPGEVDRRIGRYDALREVMLNGRGGTYDNWTTVVNEHVVRAVTARIADQLIGPAAGAAAVAKEVDLGFAYVPALVERLRRYEADRRHWPSLESYYPQLLMAFD